MENIRLVIIAIGMLVFVVSYGFLIQSAFKRDTMWGIFALFGPPFGGWAHGATNWLFTSRLMIVNVCGAVLALACMLFFPRPKIWGHWINESGTVLVRFDEDGRIRNYDLARDGKVAFRGYRLFTAELGVKSQTRLKFDGFPDIDVGYLKPREDVIDCYPTKQDPELGLAPDVEYLRLHRIPQPLTPDYQKTLTWMEARESLLEAVERLVPKPGASPAVASMPPSTRLVERYKRWTEAARTMHRAELERLPLPEQIEVLRIRLTRAEAVRTQNAAAVLEADLKDDYFSIGALGGFNVTDIAVSQDLNRGTVALQKAVSRAEYVYAGFYARRAAGKWGFDLDQRRVEMIEEFPGFQKDAPPLQNAAAYLQHEFKLTVGPDAYLPLET